MDFKLIVLGEKFRKNPDVFDAAYKKHKNRILQFGYVEDRKDYIQWLGSSDILPVTSNQDFFGISVVEAVFCGIHPVLPRRLSYPEIFPPQLFSQHYYDNFENLVDKLIELVSDPKLIGNPELRIHLKKYAWENKTAEYDDFFENLCN